VIIIPNNEIMLRDIINYTTITEKIRVRIDIGIAYDADMQKAKKIMQQAADSAGWVAKSPPPKVVLRNFGESSVDLQLRVWIANPRKRMDTISYITDKVKELFDEQGVEIPYPKRDVYVTEKAKIDSKFKLPCQSPDLYWLISGIRRMALDARCRNSIDFIK
jgi:small conductance mechanosensitive channel